MFAIQVTLLFVFRKRLPILWHTWKNINWCVARTAVLLVAYALAAAFIVDQYWLWGNYSLWHLFGFDDRGNFSLQIFKVGHGFTGLSNTLFTINVLVFKLFLVPHFAWAEEYIFRRKVITFWKRLAMSVLFGLAHIIAGVSIGVALVLIVHGFVFSHVYVKDWLKSRNHKEALMVSTTYHTWYNNFLLIFFMVVTTMGW